MNNNNLIPLAIVVAGIFIAGAIFINTRDGSDTPTPSDNGDEGITMVPVTADDHILGNPDADIIIVEYSDLECPFCKAFHATMNQVIEEYGKDGRVAWVYRHFPLSSLHPKAPKESEASECAAELGGNQGFWDYVNRLFEVTPSNNGLNLDLLPEIAEDVGLDRVAFEACLESGKYADKVATQFNDARASGASGTPFNLFVIGEDIIPLEGAIPFEQLKGIIDQALLTL